MKRRAFLRLGATAGLAGGAGASWAAPAARRVEKVGIQLFTLRNAMARDAAATLKVVAAAGYSEVETAGTGNLSASEFKEALDAAGLTSPAAHLPINLVNDGPDAAIELAQLIGQRYIVVPWLPAPMRNVDGYSQLIDSLNTFGEHCRSEGIQLCYHNHDFEFDRIGGEIVFDRLLRECDATLVEFELDFFWATHAGADVARYLVGSPERFPLCHIKDRDADGNMVDVGQGDIDFESLLAAGTGLRHYFIEHDRPTDPLVTMITSAQAVREMRF